MRPLSARLSGALFPLHERIKGHETLALRRALERSQWWTPEALAALQGERLQALMRDLTRRHAFYRDWFHAQRLNPEDVSSLEALRALPVIDKALIRAQGARWQSEGARGLVTQRTSGSTGEPLAFWVSRRRISLDIAARWRALRWWDLDIGDRELVLWGSGIEHGRQDRLRAWRDRLLGSRLVSTQDLTPSRLDALLAELRRWRPRMLFGYPSALARLAWHARERGQALDGLGIRAAFTTAEVLRPEWRALIATTFGCGVGDEYGARDAGLIARECPQGGLHLTSEALMVEILDPRGEPLPPGETGDIAVTHLLSAEFPILRYRTGDRGWIHPAPCACGRGLPRLGGVEGRANDGLIARDGRWVHASACNQLLRDLDGLRAYRIDQDTAESLRLRLVLERPLSETRRARLRQALCERLGALDIGIEQVAFIPPEPSGKFRHVVCHLPMPWAGECGA